MPRPPNPQTDFSVLRGEPGAASAISVGERERLLRHGLSAKVIEALGEIVIQAREDQSQYCTPAEVRAAISEIKQKIGPLQNALAACHPWAASIIEAWALAPRPRGAGLRKFTPISNMTRDIRNLAAAIASAERSKNVNSAKKGKADVKRSAAQQVAELLKRQGYPEERKVVEEAIDVVLRSAGFKYKAGPNGENTARQFLKPEKSTPKRGR